MSNITATGVRGYLQWLREDQPEVYARAAPLIAQQVPEAFSDFEQSRAMGAAFAGLGQDETDDTDALLNLETTGTEEPATSDIALESIDTSGIDSGTLPQVDVADAANTGAADPATTSAIGSIVSGIVGTASSAWNSMNQSQLASATAGTTPSPYSSAASGIGSLFSNMSAGSTGLLVVGGIAALVLLIALA